MSLCVRKALCRTCPNLWPENLCKFVSKLHVVRQGYKGCTACPFPSMDDLPSLRVIDIVSTKLIIAMTAELIIGMFDHNMVDERSIPKLSILGYFLPLKHQDYWSNGAPAISAYSCRTNGWGLLIQTLSFSNCRCFKKHCESSLRVKPWPPVIWPPSFWATPDGFRNRNERA